MIHFLSNGKQQIVADDTPEGAIHSTLVGLFLRFGENGYGKALVLSTGYIDKTKKSL